MSVIDPLQQTQYRNWQKGEEIVAGLNLHFFFCKESNLESFEIIHIIIVIYFLSFTKTFIVMISYRKEIETTIETYGCNQINYLLERHLL